MPMRTRRMYHHSQSYDQAAVAREVRERCCRVDIATEGAGDDHEHDERRASVTEIPNMISALPCPLSCCVVCSTAGHTAKSAAAREEPEKQQEDAE